MNHELFKQFPDLKPENLSLTFLKKELEYAQTLPEESEERQRIVKLVNHAVYLEHWLNALYKKKEGKDFDGHAGDCAFSLFWTKEDNGATKDDLKDYLQENGVKI